MIYSKPIIRIMGDRSILVEIGDQIHREVNLDVRKLYHQIVSLDLIAIEDVVPCYASVLIVFDPLRMSHTALCSLIRGLAAGENPVRIPEPRTLKVPVVYGGEFGPDLNWVAEVHGLQPEDVIRIHSGVEYYVYMIGFTPGYPYLGEVPDAIMTPRRATPRTRVPKGSVGIARKQTGIYPVESPGGWQIIGRTPMELFTPSQWPPTQLELGDRVVFQPIDEKEFETWAG